MKAKVGISWQFNMIEQTNRFEIYLYYEFMLSLIRGLALILLSTFVMVAPTSSSYAKDKCGNAFYGFDKKSKVSKECSKINLKNIKWPIGSTAVCKDNTFSFSNNKKSMCKKAGGILVIRKA